MLIIGVTVGIFAAIVLFSAAKNTVPQTAKPNPAGTSFYKNDETMSIWRDANGYITKTKITRDAKTGA